MCQKCYRCVGPTLTEVGMSSPDLPAGDVLFVSNYCILSICNGFSLVQSKAEALRDVRTRSGKHDKFGRDCSQHQNECKSQIGQEYTHSSIIIFESNGQTNTSKVKTLEPSKVEQLTVGDSIDIKTLKKIDWPDELFECELGTNKEFDTQFLRTEYSSFTTPMKC